VSTTFPKLAWSISTWRLRLLVFSTNTQPVGLVVPTRPIPTVPMLAAGTTRGALSLGHGANQGSPSTSNLSAAPGHARDFPLPVSPATHTPADGGPQTPLPPAPAPKKSKGGCPQIHFPLWGGPPSSSTNLTQSFRTVWAIRQTFPAGLPPPRADQRSPRSTAVPPARSFTRQNVFLQWGCLRRQGGAFKQWASPYFIFPPCEGGWLIRIPAPTAGSPSFSQPRSE